MALINLNALPSLTPIPKPNCHVIGGGEEERLSRMDDNNPDVIWMRLKSRDLLRGVVIIHSELEIIRAASNPVLTCYEATSANGNIGDFEGFDNRLRKDYMLVKQYKPRIKLTCVW